MEDSFFGFNTTLDEDGLHDDPGQGLDEEEEEYDALNEETFGADAVECDWEQDHEKLAKIAEQSRVHHNSCNNEDLDLEASVAHLVLEDGEDEEMVFENGATSTPEKPAVSRDLATSSYSSSAPSGFSLWSTSRQDFHPFSQPPPLPVHPSSLSGGKNVCTVEELERGLIPHPNHSTSSAPPGLKKPASVLLLEDLERDLTANTTFQGLAVSVARGQPPLPSQQDLVLLRNSQNALASMGRGHFPTHLPAPPVLGIGRGSSSGAPFGQVVMPARPVGIPRGVPLTGLQQLQQQNHRLMGSAPNLLRFLPPHVMVPQVPPPGKGISHTQGFPADNGLLRSIHHRVNNNIAYPPNFSHVEHRPGASGPFSIRPDRPLGPHFNNMRSGNNFQSHSHRTPYHHFHRNAQNGSGDYDEYAGLMTPREKQWLLNIQLLQLSTDKPHIDDYYYTVFISRQPKSKAETQLQERGHRERRDSYRDREQRVYTPAQFENSLGKLQIGSVTAPRKIIDMDVVSPEGLDTTVPSSQRDTRRAKQVLLEIERLYLLLMQMEDLSNPMPEVRDSITEDKADLVQKVMSSLLGEDRLTSVMCVHKGKMLLLRLLPHLPITDNGLHLLNLWTRIFRSLMTIGRRDQGSDGLLLRFYPHFRCWVESITFASLLQLASSMLPLQSEGQDSSKTPPPVSRNVLVYALGHKFGVSVLASLLERAETLHPSLEDHHWQDWSGFLHNLVEAVGMVSSPETLPAPIDPIDPTVLNRHLGRIHGLQIEKYALLEQALTRHNSTVLDKNNENVV